MVCLDVTRNALTHIFASLFASLPIYSTNLLSKHFLSPIKTLSNLNYTFYPSIYHCLSIFIYLSCYLPIPLVLYKVARLYGLICGMWGSPLSVVTTQDQMTIYVKRKAQQTLTGTDLFGISQQLKLEDSMLYLPRIGLTPGLSCTQAMSNRSHSTVIQWFIMIKQKHLN